jgi:hypothetical protein
VVVEPIGLEINSSTTTVDDGWMRIARTGLALLLAMATAAVVLASPAGSVAGSATPVYQDDSYEALDGFAMTFTVRRSRVRRMHFLLEGTCTALATGQASPHTFIVNDVPPIRLSPRTGAGGRRFTVVDEGRKLKLKLRMRLRGSKGQRDGQHGFERRDRALLGPPGHPRGSLIPSCG